MSTENRPMSHSRWQALEVEWYSQNGKHQDRIAVDGRGDLYVIGDHDWNRQHPDRHELTDHAIEASILRAATANDEGA